MAVFPHLVQDCSSSRATLEQEVTALLLGQLSPGLCEATAAQCVRCVPGEGHLYLSGGRFQGCVLLTDHQAPP